MNIKLIKKNNGMSLVDIVASITILSLFLGVIGTLFYQIALNSNLIKLNALAVHYAVKVAEYVDEISYEEVNDNLGIYLNSKYDIPDSFGLTVDVEKYNETDTSKEDLIKIVSINVSYTCLDETRNYEIEKIKVKEN